MCHQGLCVLEDRTKQIFDYAGLNCTSGNQNGLHANSRYVGVLGWVKFSLESWLECSKDSLSGDRKPLEWVSIQSLQKQRGLSKKVQEELSR